MSWRIDTGSTDILRHLARSTLLIDDYGGSYRYHTLLRDFLQRELAIREPERVTALHRRAAAWYQANHAIERAVDHAFAAGDPDLVATLVGNGFVRLPLVRPPRDDPSMGPAFGLGRSRGPPMARRAGSLGGDRRGRRRSDDTLRGCRRARSVRGKAARRHGFVRVRAGDAPSRHGSPWGGRRAGERHPSGRARRGPWLVAGLRAVAAGLRAPHDRRSGGRGRSPWPTRSSRPDRRATVARLVLRARTPRSRGRRTGRLGCRGCSASRRAMRSTRLHRSTGTSRASRLARSASG